MCVDPCNKGGDECKHTHIQIAASRSSTRRRPHPSGLQTYPEYLHIYENTYSHTYIHVYKRTHTPSKTCTYIPKYHINKYTHLEILSKLLLEGVPVVAALIFQVSKHIQTFFHNAPRHHTKHRGLLQNLAPNIQRQILHKTKPKCHEVLFFRCITLLRQLRVYTPLDKLEQYLLRTCRARLQTRNAHFGTIHTTS